MPDPSAPPVVAVFIPCLNEDATVARVVADFRAALPQAAIYVFDNLSTDQTAHRAADAGATVVQSPDPGKGHVVRHAFATIRADYLFMIDGDGTYPVNQAPRLLRTAVEGNCDMVCGARLEQSAAGAFRPLHRAGNLAFTAVVRYLFGDAVRDVLTGYRVFSRRFVETIAPTVGGFEIETELTIRALASGLVIKEIPVPYGARPAGSRSKLRTFRDGWLIARTIWRLRREYRGRRP